MTYHVWHVGIIVITGEYMLLLEILKGLSKEGWQLKPLSDFQKLQIGKNTHTYVYKVLSNRICQGDGSVLSVLPSYGSHSPYVAMEHLKRGQCEWGNEF